MSRRESVDHAAIARRAIPLMIAARDAGRPDEARAIERFITGQIELHLAGLRGGRHVRP